MWGECSTSPMYMYRVRPSAARIAFARIMLDLARAEKSLSILGVSEYRVGDYAGRANTCGYYYGVHT